MNTALNDTTPQELDLHANGSEHPEEEIVDENAPINEDRTWREGEWTAQVMKNEDDEGWAVAMTLRGHAEPALVGPWTMGRNKKDPKPLDDGAFRTLVKTANEILMRHAQQLHAQLHRNLTIETLDGDVKVSLDITPSEDDPFATLTAEDRFGELLGSTRVEANFKLNAVSAKRWADRGFGSL